MQVFIFRYDIARNIDFLVFPDLVHTKSNWALSYKLMWMDIYICISNALSRKYNER